MCHIHKRDFDTLMLQALCYASIKVLDSSQLLFFTESPNSHPVGAWCMAVTMPLPFKGCGQPVEVICMMLFAQAIFYRILCWSCDHCIKLKTIRPLADSSRFQWHRAWSSRYQGSDLVQPPDWLLSPFQFDTWHFFPHLFALTALTLTPFFVAFHSRSVITTASSHPRTIRT